MGCSCSKHVSKHASKHVTKSINKYPFKKSEFYTREFARLTQPLFSERNEMLPTSGPQNIAITSGRHSDGNRKVITSPNNIPDSTRAETSKGESKISPIEGLGRSGSQASVTTVTNSERSNYDEEGLVPNHSESKVADTGTNLDNESRIGDRPNIYSEEEPREGYCYIFNYQIFKKEPSRPGSEKDVDRLRHDFKELNFNVIEHLNLDKKGTLRELKKAAKKDHKSSKYFVCCFLTYGKDGELLMHDGYLKVDALLECFSRSACKSLSRKPKIFIFPACRREKEELVFRFHQKIPDYLDFLFIYSTHEGYLLPKKESGEEEGKIHGSFFINELCRTLEQFSGETDLLQILTIVNYRVAHFGLNTKEVADNKRHMPGFTSKLTDEVKFNKAIREFPASPDTDYFDIRRQYSPFGTKSTKYPKNDQKEYSIQNPKRIKFLHLLNTKNHQVGASSLWATSTERGYQNQVLSDWSEKELMDFLDGVAGRDFSNIDCLICFILCDGDGEDLFDVKHKKFSRRHIVNQLAGKLVCKNNGTHFKGPKIFIFLIPSLKKETWSSCIFLDSTESSDDTMIPLQSDILEITYNVLQDLEHSDQVDGVIEKLCGIFKEDSSEDFLNQLTKMNEELITDYKFYESPSSFKRFIPSFNSSIATFCLNSTLTKSIILNKPHTINE